MNQLFARSVYRIIEKKHTTYHHCALTMKFQTSLLRTSTKTLKDRNIEERDNVDRPARAHRIRNPISIMSRLSRLLMRKMIIWTCSTAKHCSN